MDEMLITYQDALHALSEMEETLDALDNEEFSPDAFRHLIETYKEASELFLNFLAEYIENVREIPIATHKPMNILTIAQEEKIITSKEFKYLSQQFSNTTLLALPETEDEADEMLENFAAVHDTMKDILDEIEI